MNRKKHFLNLISGFLFEIIILICGFVIPRIMLVNYGSDINGLTNTITQIFTYMALLEAGVGTATKMALYRPIVENDKQLVCQIVATARKYYNRVSVYYGLIVALLAIILPFVIQTSVDYWTVFIFVFFEGAAGLISFLATQKWKCFLMASGENYIVNSVEFTGKILCYAIRIVLALQGVNIALIQIGYFFVSVIKVILYTAYINRRYLWQSRRLLQVNR